jgi:hypothetical protein
LLLSRLPAACLRQLRRRDGTPLLTLALWTTGVMGVVLVIAVVAVFVRRRG